MHSPIPYLFIAVGLIIVGQFWLVRPAPFRAVAQRGGWWLAIVVLSSLSMLVFFGSIAVGQFVIGIAVLIVGAPPTWFSLIRFVRDRSQPHE